MKKVLIISYLFAPQNTIGAIRPTKIAKYLIKDNYEVDIVTIDSKSEDIYLNKDLAGINKIYKISHSEKLLKFTNKNQKNKTISKNESKISHDKVNKPTFIDFSIKKIKHFIRYLISLLYSLDFYFKFKKYVKSGEVQTSKYDVIFTTYGPTASVLCGIWLKKQFPQIRWICDFRDPMIVEFTPKFFKLIYGHIQNKACRLADHIIVVSHGYLNRITMGKYNNKSMVIPNGYDEDDLPKSNIMLSPTRFSFTYPGTLYGGRRKLSLLFSVFSELSKEGKINLDEIEFWYAGTEFSIVMKQAKEYNVEKILVNFGSLDRKACIELQSKSRFLVLATWNNTGEEGVFPGKLLEFMLFRKPIIALVSGNKLDSEVYNVVTKGKLGIGVEEIHIDHKTLLKHYILNEYNRYKIGLEPNYSPNKDVDKKYNYNGIIKQITGLIER